jgi:hypothetical protein
MSSSEQDGVVVKTLAPKIKRGKGLTRVPDGLSEDRVQFDPSRYFRVIVRDSVTKDVLINEVIQREGAHCDGGDDEVSWYMRNKGYTERLGL